MASHRFSVEKAYTLFARAALAAAAKKMMHVPCTAPICSPFAAAAAAAASGAAQFILRVRAGCVRYIRVLRKSVPPSHSIPHVRGIEPRLLSRPRLCTHCAHVNGHIDTGVWRTYRERACLAPHRRRPATTDRCFGSSLSLFLPLVFYVSFFSICYPAFVTTRSVCNDDISLPLALLFPPPSVLSFPLVLPLPLGSPCHYDFCDMRARRPHTVARTRRGVAAARRRRLAIDVGRIRNFDTRRSLSGARARAP